MKTNFFSSSQTIKVAQYLLVGILLFMSRAMHGQNVPVALNIMFYNVENLFDTLNDPATKDEEFLPESARNWNSVRYHQKIIDLYKVIIAAGKWEPPALVGFAEVENEHVLSDLIEKTPLKKLNYQIIHHDSRDQRGIDVALIYRSDLISPISYQPIPIELPWPTRDILLFTGKINNDTVHFFVNHWPSRVGGKDQSDPARIKASEKLIWGIDSIFQFNENAKVIAMGDFNDEPADASLKNLLNSKFSDNKGNTFQLSGIRKEDGNGTTVYTDVFKNWYLFDQIFISDNITVNRNPEIIKLPWLLNYNGDPNRTFLGDFYNGGISDHLPVMAGILCN